MTNTEFKATLTEAFNMHLFMNERTKRTVNELLYVLRRHAGFGGKDYNISICKKNGNWWSIPTLDAFVSIPTLSLWFDVDKVEFEIEDWGKEKYNCITIYESEE